MLNFYRLKLPFESLLHGFSPIGGALGSLASINHSMVLIPRVFNKDFVRLFNTFETSDKNSMVLTKSLSNMNSTLESGTINVVKVPNLGKNTDKCKIFKWMKKTGDYVNVDDLLCIVETDLIFGKVFSQVAGTIVENVNNEGSIVSVGSDLAVLVNDDLISRNSSETKTDMHGFDGKRWFSTSINPYFRPLSTFKPQIFTSPQCFSRLRNFSTEKYVPMISFGKSKVQSDNSSVSQNSNFTPPQPKASKSSLVFDDYYKSPFRLWFRNLSEEEINLVNHGTIDVKQ